MFGALAEGTTTATGFLEGQDALCTVQAFRDMGVVFVAPSKGRLKSMGLACGLKAPENVPSARNSGTSIRLLSGLLAPQTFDSVMTAMCLCRSARWDV